MLHPVAPLDLVFFGDKVFERGIIKDLGRSAMETGSWVSSLCHSVPAAAASAATSPSSESQYSSRNLQDSDEEWRFDKQSFWRPYCSRLDGRSLFCKQGGEAGD
jgi:hypothetical protein